MIINLLIAYGALQALFIAIVLLRANTRSRFNRLFAALLVIEGVTLIERLLVETDLIVSAPHLLGISYPISFLKPPLMLLMALAITDRNFRLRYRQLWHMIPFGLMFLINLPFYFLSGPDKLKWVQVFMERIPTYTSFDFYFSLSFFAYIGIYILLSIKKLDRLRQHVTNNPLVNWYRTMLLIYSGFLLLHLGYFVLQPAAGLNFELFNQVSLLAMTFIIQAIAFKLVDKSVLLTTKTPDLSDLEKRKQHEELILTRLEQDQPYLDDGLTLQQFSDLVQLPKPYVSELINQKFNCTFKKLLNQYRLKEAKRLMETHDESGTKLIDIAFQAGFNNKVTFYRVFKEWEGISPSEYLEKQKKTRTG